MLAPDLAADPSSPAAQLGCDKLARLRSLPQARCMGEDLGSLLARQIREFVRQLSQLFAAASRHSRMIAHDSETAKSPNCPWISGEVRMRSRTASADTGEAGIMLGRAPTMKRGRIHAERAPTSGSPSL